MVWASSGSVRSFNGSYHAFLYSNRAMQDLGTLSNFGNNSMATGINNQGQVVGSSSGHGFLYVNHTMQDLGPGYARSINAMGR